MTVGLEPELRSVRDLRRRHGIEQLGGGVRHSRETSARDHAAEHAHKRSLEITDVRVVAEHKRDDSEHAGQRVAQHVQGRS